jgi:hypothetical protein
VSLSDSHRALAAPFSPLVNQELERDRAFHPNLGGVTKGGMANHYPMTLIALHGLGASDDEVEAFRAAWPRHRASIADDLRLVDRRVVTVDNWHEFLGHAERLPELRRVFEELLTRRPGLSALPAILADMQDALPMGLFHPLIRVYFATLHGDRALVADALAYMAIRYFDLYRSDSIPARDPGNGSRSAESVWRDLAANDDVTSLVRSVRGGSIRICEELCASATLHAAALPADFDLSAASLRTTMPAICSLAIRLHVRAPSLTTLHAVTAAQALADLTLRAGDEAAEVFAALWARYWIWLTALHLEKGRPAELPVSDERDAPAESWSELSARARAIPEVHLIKMTFSCRWLDETFGPEPLYKVAITNVLAKHDD